MEVNVAEWWGLVEWYGDRMEEISGMVWGPNGMGTHWSGMEWGHTGVGWNGDLPQGIHGETT